MKKRINIIATGIICISSILAFFLCAYSFTQVDLGMTLSKVSVWQTIQKNFQYIGYFNRPLSTNIFLGIVISYFFLYGLVMWAIIKKQFSFKQLWSSIMLTAIILLISYPAFSYDLFNHMFTAKTILIYHQNPYLVTPMQFIGIDPWLSFLHWTHVTSVYSPLWIVLTLIPYILGFGYFVLQLWNFKLLMVACYLLTTWSIGKILDKEGEVHKSLGVAIFALNPLVIIESTVSAHNDIVMMGIALFAIAIYKKNAKVWSLFMLAVSTAMKIMTIFLLPSYLLKWNRTIALLGMVIGLGLFLTQREIMGWYLLWVIPFVALFPSKWNLFLLTYGISLGILLRYAPFLYYGNWDAPVPAIKTWVTVVPTAVATAAMLLRHIFSKRKIQYFFN